MSGFLGLFLELALIRWAPSQISVLAYYTNFVLLAAFLGLGLGTLLRCKARLLVAFPLLVFVTVNVLALAERLDFEVRLTSGLYLWQMSEGLPLQLSLPGVLLAAFVILALPFLPVGVAMARAFTRVPPLKGYAWNIGGSLAGIVSFTILSAVGTPPWVWFAVVAALAWWLFPCDSRVWRLGGAGLMVLLVALVFLAEMPYLWSPYYRVELYPLKGDPPRGYELRVNKDYHQLILDLSDKGIAAAPEHSGWRELYDLPYAFHKGPDVLIVGAGSGNDAAAALRAGVKRIDAVEIDPMILRIGKRLHPEKPYQRDEVRLICEDARAFFRKTDRRYDLVVFGFLDSHTLLSSLSSVRLDSYVYTLESLEEARALLKPDGVLALTFSIEREWMGQRIYRMLETAFAEAPVIRRIPGTNGTVFLNGPGLDRSKLVNAAAGYGGSDIVMATDAWPFLYFQRPGLPKEYIAALCIIGLVSFLSILAVSWRTALRPRFFYFFLGAGFMLLETRSVTVMALLFGSTWLTNAVVFSMILLLILAATLWTQMSSRRKGVNVPLLLVVASVLLVYAFPLGRFLAASHGVKWLVAAVPMLPILFAGVLFARAFRSTAEPEVAFGSNLLGAVAGGLCEYASLQIGFPNLVWIALAFYVCAWGARRG